MARCRCGTGRKYRRCCGPLHAGKAAATPEALMRSRYAAYAMGLVDYIIATTDPSGPHWQADAATWRREVERFCAGTGFDKLSVTESVIEDTEGWVTFRAALTQLGRDASFGERSRFRRVDERWLYHSGERLPTP